MPLENSTTTLALLNEPVFSTVVLGPRTFKLELAALFGVVVLVAQSDEQVMGLSRIARWIHFTLVALYSLIGIAGARFVLMFALAHSDFVELFSQGNVIGVNHLAMQSAAVVFAFAGSALFLSAMLLGKLRKRPRRLFSSLVLPCGVMYPLVMLTALGVIHQTPRERTVMYSGIGFLLIVGVLAVWFYHAETVARRMR